MSRAGVNEGAFGKKWGWIRRNGVFLLYISQLWFAFIPSAKGSLAEGEDLHLPSKDDFSREEVKRGAPPLEEGRELFLQEIMPRFSRRTTDHMLRFTRSGGDDHHMLRFTRSGEDEGHMLRFNRNSDDDYMLRFNRRGSDDMHRFNRGGDHMLRYSRKFSGEEPVYRATRSEKSHGGTGIPLDLHMLRFSKRNDDDNHMLRYSRAPDDNGEEEEGRLLGSTLPQGPTHTFSRFTRKIMDSMRPRLVRQDDHLLRFA